MTETATITWEPGRHPVSGVLVWGAHPAHPFTGWLELLGLLQSALGTSADDATAPDPRRDHV